MKHLARIKLLTVCLIIIVASSLTTGCGNISTYAFETIENNVDISENYHTRCINYFEGYLTFSLEKEIDVSVGPLSENRAFLVYDTSQKLTSIFPIETGAPYRSAVAIESGILYIDYSHSQEQYISEVPIKWSVIFKTKGEKKIIKEGTALSLYELPQISMIEEKPVILWKDSESNEWGASIVSYMGLEDLFMDNTYNLVDTTMQGNGSNICFLTSNENDDLFISIVDKDGKNSYIPIDGKITSYAIAKNNLICGIAKGTNIETYSLLNVNLSDLTESTVQLAFPVYRLTGGNSDFALCVGPSFEILKINGKSSNIETIQAPLGYSSKPVEFSNIINNKCIVSFMDGKKYEHFTFKVKKN